MAVWGAEVFFHLAAQMDVRHSITDPIGHCTGSSPPPRRDPTRRSHGRPAPELRGVGPDSTAARRMLGWQARVDLPESVARTLAGLRDQGAVLLVEQGAGRRGLATAFSHRPAHRTSSGEV